MYRIDLIQHRDGKLALARIFWFTKTRKLFERLCNYRSPQKNFSPKVFTYDILIK
jgi:hypothetical protein